MTHKAEMTALGKFLRRLRVDHGCTQREMASAIGITGAYLSAVEAFLLKWGL